MADDTILLSCSRTMIIRAEQKDAELLSFFLGNTLREDVGLFSRRARAKFRVVFLGKQSSRRITDG
jgi:hypothetical protein